MNARLARKRQQVIELTLAGLNEILFNNATLLQEMDPEQEARFEKLIIKAARTLEIEL